MELWIRSQDKMVLTKNVGIRIVLEQEGASIVDETNDYILGMYNTKKRALEVLDEIQKILKSSFIVNGLKEYISQSNTTIYEMPEV